MPFLKNEKQTFQNLNACHRVDNLKHQTKVGTWQAWLIAARPRTLPLSIIPVVVGTVLASITYTASINWYHATLYMLAGICLQIGTNMVNDALDFERGADTAERLGPIRATQSGMLSMRQVLGAGVFFMSLAFLFMLPLMWVIGWWLAGLVVICVLCAYLYTGGPYPLAYYGFGDFSAFFFFGIVATLLGYYIQVQFINTAALLVATQIGLLVTVPIAINNLRDYVEDAKAHKNTLVVRYGRLFGKYEITCLALSPFLLNAQWAFWGYSLIAWLPILALPLATVIIRGVWQLPPGKAYNKLLALSILLHTFFGALLTLGILFE